MKRKQHAGSDTESRDQRSNSVEMLVSRFYNSFVEAPLHSKLLQQYYYIHNLLNSNVTLQTFWNDQIKKFTERFHQLSKEESFGNALLPSAPKIKFIGSGEDPGVNQGNDGKAGTGLKLDDSRNRFNSLRRYVRFKSSRGVRLILQYEQIIKNQCLQSGSFNNGFMSSLLLSRMDPSFSRYFVGRYQQVEEGKACEEDIGAIIRYCTADRRCTLGSSKITRVWGVIAFETLVRNGRPRSHPIGRFSCINFDEAYERSIKSANSGWPTFLKKNNLMSGSIAKILFTELITNPNYIKLNSDLISGKPVNPSKMRLLVADLSSNIQIIYHRLQVSIKNDEFNGLKIRQVWCVPLVVVCIERMFFSDLLDSVYANGLEAGLPVFGSGINQEVVGNIIQNIRSISSNLGTDGEFNFYQSDYKKFDSTVPKFFHRLFFTIAREYIDIPEELTLLYEILLQYEESSPFVYKGLLLFKEQGISSGTFLTSIMGSWVNLTLTIAAKNVSSRLTVEQKKIYLEPSSFMSTSFPMLLETIDLRDDIHSLTTQWGSGVVVCGDDLLWVSNTVQNNVLIHLCDTLGMTVLFSDPYFGNECNIYFLGRYWDKFNRPFQPIAWYVSHILFRTKRYDFKFEGFDSYEHFEVDRLLSIARGYTNGKDILKLLFLNGKQSWPRLEEAIGNPDYQFRVVDDRSGRGSDGRLLMSSVREISDWKHVPI